MLILDADISSGMILQREEQVPVSGSAEPGAEVCATVRRGGETVAHGRAQAGEDGRFTVMLPPVSGGCQPCELEITSGSSSLVLADVLFGDVFHIMGQSNMELPLRRVYDPFDPSKPFSGGQRIPDCNYIREFRAPIIPCFDPAAEDDHWQQGEWFPADSPKAADMSAAGYFFARELFDRYGIPVGLVNTSAGGAPIEAFLPCDELRALHCCDEFLDEATVPGWMERTAEADSHRCEKYHAKVEQADVTGEKVLAGKYPAGESISLPFETEDFSGRLWLWTEFHLPELPDCGGELLLGTVTDSDAAYINGVKVGETGYMYPPRYYDIPAGLLRPGRNRLAVRLDIFGRRGGFTPGKRWCLRSGGVTVDLTDNWHCVRAVTTGGLREPAFFQGLPLSMYAVTAPAYRRKFKGLVIYQGESNDRNTESYRRLFSHFIGYYRRRCGWEIPVIFTQLPEFGGDGSWTVLRQAQLDCTELPRTAMAVTIGTGELNDLHPINKWDVGRRLARCAVKLIYEGGECRPVRCTGLTLTGRTAVLSFSEEVTLAAGEPGSFQAMYAGGIMAAEPEQLTPTEIRLTLPEESPAEVRYAWMQSPSPRLFDRDGMPVSPFRVIPEQN